MASRFAWIALGLAGIAACSGHAATPAGASSSGVGGAGDGGAGEGGGTGGSSAGGGGAGPTSSAGVGGESDAGAADASDGGNFDCQVLGVPGHCMDAAACNAMANHASTAGLCPGASSVECCTPFGKALCDETVMPHADPNAGNLTEAPGQGGCPAGMLRITTFCVDKYEATLVRGDDGTAWSPYYNPGTVPMLAVSVAGAVPQGYIDGIQAGEACMNAGKRLCTDTEWLRACQGPGDTTYPYGNTKELGVCNDHRKEHPAIEYFGTSASWIWSEIDNACINQIPESVDLTGAQAGCVTAEGAFDMMGNLHEWTADPAGTFRGGYYVDTVINGPGCLYATTAHNTLHWDYSTGFRCCAD